MSAGRGAVGVRSDQRGRLALRTGASDQAKAAYEARIEAYANDRVFAFDFAVALTAEIPPLLKALNLTAHYSFEAHETLVRKSMGLTE